MLPVQLVNVYANGRPDRSNALFELGLERTVTALAKMRRRMVVVGRFQSRL